MRKRALSAYRALHLLPPKGLIEAVDAFVGQEVFEQVAGMPVVAGWLLIAYHDFILHDLLKPVGVGLGSSFPKLAFGYDFEVFRPGIVNLRIELVQDAGELHTPD